MLNGAIGYQMLDDGTPISITLVLASSLVFFIGTGYIALDTAFSWTGEWDQSWEPLHRNIALYVLYQLWPLICLVVFFILETVLVIRILGEVRPMGMLFLDLLSACMVHVLTTSSISDPRGNFICNRPNLQLRDQYAYLPSDTRQNQRRPVRNPLYAPVCHRGLHLLEQYYRRRLVHADDFDLSVQLDDFPPLSFLFCSIYLSNLFYFYISCGVSSPSFLRRSSHLSLFNAIWSP